MKITTRSEAMALGLTRYFTGKPCKKGHLAERRVIKGTCNVCCKQTIKSWYDRNKNKSNATARSWRQRNSARLLRNARLRYKADPTVQKSISHNYRARKRQAKGFHTSGDLQALFKKQQGLCLCGFNLHKGYHVDHKTPLSRGGSNWPRNLQLLCAPCNTSKGAKTVKEWRRV